MSFGVFEVQRLDAVKKTSSYHDFTTIFALRSVSTEQRGVSDLLREADVNRKRQRRAHNKSRKGCAHCQRRRVKCDEKTPCANCVRRGDRCTRRVIFREQTPLTTAPFRTESLKAALDGFGQPGAIVNSGQLRLLHHFQTCTRQTLLFVPEIWDRALQLSASFASLENAILCIAARHLSTLQPENAMWTATAAMRLCRCLSAFRLELSNDLTSTHLDVFIATSTLLQFELWASVDCVALDGTGMLTVDLTKDALFSFSSSLKEMFLRSFPPTAMSRSFFLPHIQNHSLNELVEAAMISNSTLAAFQAFFSHQRSVCSDMLKVPLPYVRGADQASLAHWRPHAEVGGNVRIPIITQICLVSSFLPEAKPPVPIDAYPSLLPRLARHILLFPITCRGEFESMISRSDPNALLLLYHLYRAVRILLTGGAYWWAQKRASRMEMALGNWLNSKCGVRRNTTLSQMRAARFIDC